MYELLTTIPHEYENGEISAWTDVQRVNTRKLIEAQLDAYDKGTDVSNNLISKRGVDLLDC